MQTESKISVEKQIEKQDHALSIHKNNRLYKVQSRKLQLLLDVREYS